MPGSEPPTGPIRIACIGDVIFEAVQASPATKIEGTVHSVFRRCAYLQFDQSIFCLALSELGAGPITLLLNPSTTVLPDSLKQGHKVVLDSESLCFSNGRVLSIRTADVFVSFVSAQCVSDNQMGMIVKSIAKMHPPSVGIATLLNKQMSTGLDAVLLKFLEPAIDEFLRALEARLTRSNGVSTESIAANNKSWLRLVGAGPGLTPSGDDFLAGAFHALYLTGHGQCAQVWWTQIAPHCHAATTDISFALLEQSAAGRQSEHVQLLTWLIIDEQLHSPTEVGRQLDHVGASSGWDWCTGFVMCLKVITGIITVNAGSTKADDGHFENTACSSAGVHLA